MINASITTCHRPLSSISVHKLTVLYLLAAVRTNEPRPHAPPDSTCHWPPQLEDNAPLAGALSDLALNLLGFELLNYGSLTASNSWYEEGFCCIFNGMN